MRKTTDAWMRRGAVLALVALTAACATTKTASNKAASYAGEPKRILVFEAFIKSRYLEPSDFDARLVQSLAACGVAAETRIVPVKPATSLTLDDDEEQHRSAAADQMKRFGPDTTLTVLEIAAVQRVFSERVSKAQFMVSLRDVATRKTVWKAQINLSGGFSNSVANNLGHAVADAVAARLSQDGILRGCPASVTNAAPPA
jgi:hypothetical protein